MGGRRPLAFGCFLGSCLVGLRLVLGLLVFFSPSSRCFSFPFNDDLGTPPTRSPHSWKKKAGEKLPIAVDPNAHICLRGFENAVLAELPYLGCNSTLGRKLQFVQTDTHQVLADPIQSKLRANHCYYVIAQQCFVEATRKGQLKGEAKAIRVPRGRSDKIPPQAFSFHTEVRHVLVEHGIRIRGSCVEELSTAAMPETVVSLLHGAFSRCQVLRVVTAPGCKHFGTKVFEECCSLTQIGVTRCPGNTLAPQAQLRPRVFQGCRALHHLDLGKSGCSPTNPNRSLPDCCFLEAGIVALFLPSDFNRIGTAACVSCQQLQTVDLSHSRVIELLGSTFAYCSQLQQLSLPQNLRIIEQEAFLKCTSLQEVCVPPSLLYIARRAFAGCTQLRAVRKKGKSQTWRGTYARLNAFDKCEQLDKPEWLRFLPPNAKDQWREDFQEAIP